MVEVFCINSLLVSLCVLIHYEFLLRASLVIQLLKIKNRFKVVIAVFAALIAHAIEIWIFAIAYFILNQQNGWGKLTGAFNQSLLDCSYFSFTTFTTLGFGDITPIGNLRYLTGIESLTGLILITWSASFLYYEMQKFWD